MTATGPIRRLCDQIIGYTRSVTDGMLDSWLTEGLLSMDEHIMLRRVMDDYLMQLVMSMPQDIGGRMLPNPGMMTFSANGAAEVKVGRRLSTASVDKITAAIEALRALLTEPGVQDEGEEEEKSALAPLAPSVGDTAPSQDGTGTVSPTVNAVGSDVTPPPSGYEALKRDLDTEFEQVRLMFGGTTR